MFPYSEPTIPHFSRGWGVWGEQGEKAKGQFLKMVVIRPLDLAVWGNPFY
jgi:hypothetical protein